MIPVARPPAADLPPAVRAALTRRQLGADTLLPGDSQINRRWKNFLRSSPRTAVGEALDAYCRSKCVYCEAVVPKDVDHFYPKSKHPDRMFRWDNFLRACGNCNFYKLDLFPLTPIGGPVFLDPTADDPLDYFVWDFATGAIGVRPTPGYAERGTLTRERLRLDTGPLRQERLAKLQVVKYLLRRVIDEQPVTAETRHQLQAELDPMRPWLGIIRQLFRRPDATHSPLVAQARAKLPVLDEWVVALG